MPARRHPAEAELRAFALSYPETTEDFPWGHRALKVRGKAFVFMSKDEPELSLSVKLPASAEGALQLAFCEPTHYGLGRSGWITATIPAGRKAPVETLRSFVDESYRAIAPKRLVAALGETRPAGAAARGARAGKAAARARKAPTSRRRARGARVPA